MKIKNIFLKAVSVVLCIVFACSLSVAVLAESTPVSIVLSSNEHLENTDVFVSKDTFESADIIYVKLTSTQIANLGGMVFTVKYDKDLLTFMKNKSICKIEDTDGENAYYPDDENGEVLIIYESSSHGKETAFTGVIYYLAFSVNAVSKNASTSISVEIDDFYDNSSSQKDIAVNTIDSISVNLVAETVSEETLELFRKLENIIYPDSKEDIDTALAAFSELSAGQKKLLSQSYTDEYEWLSTAVTRYNRLAEQASKEALMAEVEGFKKTHAKILAKTAETVTLADEKAVTKAIQSYTNLSDAAKTYLQSEGKLLPALEERISELKDIKAEIEDFLGYEAYAHIWNKEILNNRFDLNYTHYISFIQLALLNYDLLSDEAKQAVTAEYEWLTKLNDEANKYLALDEAAALLAEKAAEFQKTYLKVFMLNQNNVAESDRTAIEMVIEAYNALEDEALKEMLSPRIKTLNTLLEILDELAETGEGEPEKETVYVEVEGEKVTVEVPGETVIKEVAGETVTVTETVTVPGETEYITEYVTENNTLTNKIIRTLKQKTPLSNLILILFILLAVAIVIQNVSFVLCERYKKKSAVLAADKEADL